ncbi:MAG: type III pantothenate kinase [Gammaproteobacteria bacterium]|nr:type III pantothenate kinase [Gammaproteobacteria bacterium]
MLLAIDSGNTNIKWGIHDEHRWLVMNVTPQNSFTVLADSWQSLPPLTQIFISNVAGIGIQEAVSEIIPVSASKPVWIEAVVSECGLYNNYYQSKSLGSDRWAAMVSVWNRYHEPCLIVSLGTAMTIDMVSESGDFVGGIITPGVKVLSNALVEKTCLPKADSGIYDSFSLSTENALFTGTIDALVGVIEKSHHAMLSKYGYKSVRCILSGGDSNIIYPHLNLQFEIIDNLVLNGLVTIAQSRKGL